MATKVLVLGTGHIGRAIAHLLSSAEGEPVFQVTVADRQVAPKCAASSAPGRSSTPTCTA